MRHRTRHLHKTMLEHVRSILNATDWLEDPPVNFAAVNTDPVTLVDYEPQSAGMPIARNTVAVSLGPEGVDRAFELGNFASEVRIPLFVDIYPTDEVIGIAMADDLKAGLVEITLPLRDFSTEPPTATSGFVETEDVVVDLPDSAATTLDKRSWRVVKAVLVFYPPAT